MSRAASTLIRTPRRRVNTRYKRRPPSVPPSARQRSSLWECARSADNSQGIRLRRVTTGVLLRGRSTTPHDATAPQLRTPPPRRVPEPWRQQLVVMRAVRVTRGVGPSSLADRRSESATRRRPSVDLCHPSRAGPRGHRPLRPTPSDRPDHGWATPTGGPVSV